MPIPSSQPTIEANILAQAEYLLKARDVAAAIQGFSEAERRGADASRCCCGRWLAYMLAGDFAQAWCESDRIRGLGVPDPHALWKGESLAGRHVIVRCLHGFGDAVQFLRYAPLLQQTASHLTVQVPPRMLELAHCMGGVEDVVTWDEEGAGPAAWDVQVEVVQLPYVFRTLPKDLPLGTRYLRVQRDSAEEAWRKTRPSVGVVWAAGEWNPERSVPFSLWSRMLQDRRFQFLNLQGGQARSDWSALPRAEHVVDAEECASGILPLARIIDRVDLVITVDTLAAHLAGALGRPAWVLLPFAADWRWMVEREESPWYPTLRLFRQPVAGDWQSVTERVITELELWLHAQKGLL